MADRAFVSGYNAVQSIPSDPTKFELFYRINFFNDADNTITQLDWSSQLLWINASAVWKTRIRTDVADKGAEFGLTILSANITLPDLIELL